MAQSQAGDKTVRMLWNQQDTSDQCTVSVPLVDSGTFIFDYMFHQERLKERRQKNLSAFVYVYQPLTNSIQSRIV